MTDKAQQITIDSIKDKSSKEIFEMFDNNKSAAIRHLYSLGMKKYHIAKKLEVIPQFVSNVTNRPLKKS